MSFDCQNCHGENRAEMLDCATCGGTGWHPPTRDADRLCNGCGRGLWLGGRGPKWYTHRLDPRGIRPLCYHCLAKIIERRCFRRRGTSIPTTGSQPITPRELN